MLPRVLEPEVMDSEEEVREYETMDHSTVNQRFVDELIAAGPVGPKVIDLGCGPGAIAILLAQQLPDIQVMGIDSAVGMLEVAKMEIELGGVLDQVFLAQADAKDLSDFEDGMADTVISNSLLHHLAEPHAGLASAVRLVRPGGRIFLRDLFRPESDQAVEALVAQYAGEETEFAQQLLRQSFHAALTLEAIQQLAGGLGISPQQVQMSSDRHWTVDWQRPD